MGSGRGTRVHRKVKQTLRIENLLLREAFAEFIGTFILIAFGDASVAQFILGRGEYGQWLAVNWGWAVGVAVGVWASGGVSGGHINPAVTGALCVLGRCPWIKFPIYMLAQYLGAFVASGCVYLVYVDALDDFDGGVRQVYGPNKTAGIWCTYPQDYTTWPVALWDQILGTGLLMLGVLAITDDKNMKPHRGMVAFSVGLVVLGLGICYGMNCGYAINPARDLGPRIFSSMAGWGLDVFSYNNYNYFWIPVVGPHVGAILGAWFYVLLVSNHHPPEYTDTEIPLEEKIEYTKEGVDNAALGVDNAAFGSASNGGSDNLETQEHRM